MADVSVKKEIRWALLALGLVRNRLTAMGIKAEGENGTALVNLDAAIATLKPIAGVALPARNDENPHVMSALNTEPSDEPSLPDPDIADEGSGLNEHFSRAALEEYAQAWRDFEAVQVDAPLPPCTHRRYSVDTKEQTGHCYDCGAEGRMVFTVRHEPD